MFYTSEFSLIEIIVYLTFIFAMFAMAAGALFFFFESGKVSRRYRESMVVSGLILAIAAGNYAYMMNIYEAAIQAGENAFPTPFRYVDWLLTTPLMLIKFPLLLGLGPKGRTFLIQLVTLDIVMIVAGFFGELYVNEPLLHYGLFAVGALCWLAIVSMLWRATASLPDRVDPILRQCIKVMAGFVIFGWIIYPVGYLLPSFTDLPALRPLIYNIGDVINKVGLALVVYVAAVQTTNRDVDSAAGEEVA